MSDPNEVTGLADAAADRIGRPGEGEDAPTGPVIRDRRRIDPVTGQPRPAAERPGPVGAPEAQPGASAADAAVGAQGAAGPGDAQLAGVLQQLAERTADLQRLQADYANYRRRVDRDRDLVRETALGSVVSTLLPVLDDIGRAREHGELEGGFKAVGEALEAAVAKLGVQRYGMPGEPFDPTVHEALTHSYSAEVSEPTAVAVLQPGYRVGTRIVRPARVAVAEPEGTPAG